MLISHVASLWETKCGAVRQQILPFTHVCGVRHSIGNHADNHTDRLSFCFDLSVATVKQNIESPAYSHGGDQSAGSMAMVFSR